MKRRRVLVCGATGFIGRNLVETLSRRDDLEVHAVRFTRPAYAAEGVTWHHADLREAAQVTPLLRGMDIVIQAAATTSGARDIVATPYIHVTDNAVMNSLLLRACFDHKVRHFLFFSCSVMYQPRETPWREEEWDASREMHVNYFGIGWTKLYIEKMCEFFSRLGVTKHTVIRHTNVFGPHDKFDLERSHVFGATVTKAMTSTTGTVMVWGSGEEARDLIYVDDLVRFVALAIERQTTPYEMLHASAGRAIRIKDLVARIVAASGRDLCIEHDLAGPTIRTSFALDNRRADEVLGWQPQMPFDEGVRRTIDWWRASRGVGGP
ncbi:MAG: NAD-dependent epimerase/dehydratase family protein [Alphaproteobacteria bacterium]|nr:MAG: NAD-dependent epimerase/dehydratase family protein [Alphaproteobacteria bacterium]